MMAAVAPPAGRLRSCEVEQQFPTCLMSRTYDGVEELNRRLADLLLRLETQLTDVSHATTTIGGYQTDNSLLSRNEPEVAVLRQMIGEGVKEYMARFIETECSTPPQGLRLKLWGWGVVMREGDINSQHVHPGAKISGVYYVSMPPANPVQRNPAKPEGAIMFMDPRPRAHMNQIPNQTTEIVVPPEPGLMILFPSYYEHAVLPFRGSGVRTCIAFNANF
jgi:uncharacterized protein (TIGR02466 family)